MKNDSELIDEALAGDRVAFGSLVERYQDRLYSSLVRVVGCAEEARDVAQEAFIRAMTKLDSFQGKASFYTWLYRIAFNVAISRRRGKKPMQSIDLAQERAGEEPRDSGPQPEARMEQEEMQAQVQKALHSLGDEFREIMVLREMDGFDYETIAEMLKIPIGTVRSRLFRARIQLRDAMSGLMEGISGVTS